MSVRKRVENTGHVVLINLRVKQIDQFVKHEVCAMSSSFM